MRLTEQLFAFEEPESQGDRIFFRVLESFVIAYVVWYAWKWGFAIRQLPALHFPAGLAQHVDLSFLLSHDLSLLNAGLVTVLCVLGFTRTRTSRYAYLGALLLLHLQYVARYSLGKLPHGVHFIGMSLLGLGIAFLLFRTPKLRRRAAVGFLYFFIGLGYTLAACSKLIGTGLDWPAGRHLWLWIVEKQVDTLSLVGTADLNWLQQTMLAHQALGTVVLALGLMTELFAFTMWWRPARPFIIPALIGLHVGIGLTMEITFDLYIYELILLGFPWAALIDRMLFRLREPTARRLEHARFFSA